MSDPPPSGDAALFDEAGYLRLYPGIATALMQGLIDTARNHYLRHGFQEGRRPNDVDPAFYLAAYPAMERDLGRPPCPDDAAPHFVRFGRVRGYLPNHAAPRPDNAAATGSPFGGFWTDQSNALDLIQARLDLGRISRRDAAMARIFAADGIVTFDRGPDKDHVRDAALIVDQAFTGRFADLLFETAAGEPLPWRPELTEQATAALDLHMVSRAVRTLLLDKALIDFLTVIFDARPKLTASKAWLREEAAAERDVARQAYSLPLQFVAVTFALEDSAGTPLSVWPASHRLPDLLWAEHHVSLPEAMRANAHGLPHAIAQRETKVSDFLRGREARRIGTPAGTRIIRHANLFHAVDAPAPLSRFRSLTAWYCPSHVEPGYVETSPARIHGADGVGFSSGLYPMLDPAAE